MTPNFIIDASIAIKWIKQIEEEGGDLAYSLYTKIQSEEIGVAVPDLILYELANYASRQGEEVFSDCQEMIAGIFESKMTIIPPDRESIEDATALAHELKISAYDATYLALAQRFNTKLITADKKLLAGAPNLAIPL